MKVFTRLLVVSVVLATVLMPLTALADGLPAPLDKKLTPGVHTISYAGQQLRFTTPVSLIVRFEPVSMVEIKLTVRGYGVPSGAQGAAGAALNIFWENYYDDVYNGPPPMDDDWEGILNTESGFTEK